MTSHSDFHEMVTNRLKVLSNRELLDMVYEGSEPDDYDGEFTSEGAWFCNESRRILEERLVACGFIENVVTGG